MAVRRLAEKQPEDFAFSAENRAWAERQIAKFPEDRQASAVIPLLWRAQEQEGWVTKAAIESVAATLGMPTIRVLEVATFYTMFHLEPVGAMAHVQVCGTTPCMLSGAGDLIEICRSRIHEHPHHVSADGAFSWEEVECLGACVNAPMVQVSKDTYEDLTAETFERLLDAFARGEQPRPGSQIGRRSSEPIGGLTSLTEISYADDEIAEADNRDFRPTGASERAIPEHGPADAAPDAPRATISEFAGGEQFDAEQQRRKGRAPGGALDGGTDPASGETEGQKIGRVDPTGRSDEAAARAMGERTPAKDAALPRHPVENRTGQPGADKSAQPRSDRDSPKGDKEG
jgi:NADH-quinone oxidoreductase subunit E